MIYNQTERRAKRSLNCAEALRNANVSPKLDTTNETDVRKRCGYKKYILLLHYANKQKQDMSNIYNPYDLEPFEPTHPGELLGDELEARGLTQRKFAETIGISCSVLNEVIKGKRPVTPELAFKIEAATGTKAYIWVELQTQYNYWTAKKSKKLSVLLDQIRKSVAVL